jgi:hypothetical protein
MIPVDTDDSYLDPARFMAALSYRAPFLIEKLLKERIVDTVEDGETLFAEVVKYLILNRAYPMKKWEMSSRLIDEAWHQFVLFTSEYIEFGKQYFGVYLHHAPGNSPSMPLRSPADVPSFADFGEHYKLLFGTQPPDVWQDANAITLQRRILISQASGVLSLIPADESGLMTILGLSGPLASVSELARDALAFMINAKAFYVRELPGDLTDKEKIGLVGALVTARMLSLGV